MSIIKYEVFREVCSVGNFSKAAENLNMTQSAISRSIKSLEEEFSTALFTRKKDGVCLTRFGEKVYPEIINVLNMQRKLENVVNAYNDLQTGRLVIGSFSSASSSILPDILSRFRSRYPNIQVVVKEGHYDEVRDWLLRGSVDVAFLIDEFIEGFKKHYLFSDEIMLIVPEDSPIRDRIPIKSIESYPLIASEHYPNPYLKGLFEKYKVSPDVKYVVKINQTIFAFVEKGLGLAILPETSVERANYEIRMVPFVEQLARHVYMVTKEEMMEIPSVQAFWEIVTQE